MKTELSTWEAANILFNDEHAGWSYAGALAMAEHLEEYEEQTGENIDFCFVAIRCEYSEYGTLEDVAEDYPDALSRAEEDADADERDECIREYIQDRGQLIEFDGGVIISSF